MFVKKNRLMEAIRHIITPTTTNLQILLPINLVNEELEIIILPLTDSKMKDNNAYKSLRGKLSKNEADKMLAYIEESRNEW